MIDPEPPRLRVLHPQGGQRTITITGPRFTIGRRPDCTLVIPEPDVSRLQVELFREDGRWIVEDRGSTFGTWLNGAPAGRQPLRNRDTLTMGRDQQIEMIFLIGDEASRIVEDVDSRRGRKQSRDEFRNLAILLEIVRKLSLMTSLQEMLDLTLDSILEVTQADRGFLMLRDEGGRMKIRSARRLDRERLAPEGLRFSESLVRRVMQTGEPVFVSDVLEDEPLTASASIEELALRTVVCLPLMVPSADRATRPDRFPDGSPILGVLYADSIRARSPLSEVTRQLIASIASQATFALENFLLRQEDLERRLLERETEREMDRLREIDRIKTEFLSNVSHELRTPLTAIISLIQNMVDGVSGSVDEKGRRHLARILDNAEQLGKLIDDLLDLARIEGGAMALEPRGTSIPRLLEDAAETLRSLAEKRGISIAVDPPSQELAVVADRDRLMQVLFNLIGNAIKFTPQGGWIRLAAERREEVVYVSVADNGIGISTADLERIFDRFYQIPGRDGQKTGGTGLGLPIARSLVEMHGGSLWAERTAEGTRFTFTLPPRRESP